MRKIILVLILCIPIYLLELQAQKSSMIFSEKNPEIEGGAKVKLLKNGNTALLQFSKDAGINLTLFDASKKKVIEGKIALKLIEDKLAQYKISGIFEINKDLMIMLTAYPKKTPTLYRILIDGSTGKLKNEEQLLQMPALGAGAGYSMEFGNVPIPIFYIEKDPVSDYYGIVLFNSFSKETNKRIEVSHYSPTHQQINRAFFTSPEDRFKYLCFTDIFVNGESSIIMSAYVYNTKASGNGKEESIFYFSKLSKDASVFNNKVLPYTNSFMRADCEFIYDKITKNVDAAIKTYSGYDKKGNASVFDFMIQPFNPNTMDLGKLLKFPLDKANAYYTTKVEPGKNYTGMLQNYLIDQSGNNIFLTEMPTIVVGEMGSATKLLDIAVTSMTNSGKENYGIIIPYHHSIFGSSTSFNYMSNRKGQMTYSTFDDFHGACIDLVTAKKYNYVFLNNTVTNFSKADNDRNYLFATPAYATSGHGCVKAGESGFTSVIYKIDNAGSAQKELLFEKPTVEDEAKYCLFQTADFNPETGLYSVLVIEKVKGKKMSSVLWIPLE
jgi:hypothetical protein